MAGRELLAAAGVLFPDGDGRIMLVRVSYQAKHPIEVPGGGWEETDASPRDTAVREIEEELGITPVLRELACLDWSRDVHRPPIAAYLYWAEPLTAEQRAAIRLEPEELGGYAYLTPDQALSGLPPLLSLRVGACLRAPRAAAPLELADGVPLGHAALHLPGPPPVAPYTGAAGLPLTGGDRVAPPPPMDRETYLATRPRIRAKARMLISDPDGRVLLVRLTPWGDESPWVLPGGSIEADRELPREAARREILEELGLHREPGRLLALDWMPGRSDDLPRLVYVYDGGVLVPGEAATVRVQEEEIAEWRLFTPKEAAEVLSPSAAARLTACLAARDGEAGAGPAELLNGRPVGPDGSAAHPNG
ncbi:NUDIX hydrolase [Kitasatospora sp. NPDC049285]|uniref:NUDIX hydrolase n=1 Tax=Kitasatospora sp. NPDC049285 TaxID=3157096 RepID=UPI003415E761